MIVCYSEHSFCTDFSVLELYLADSGKYSRSPGYSMRTEHLHTMRSIHTACCRNSKSSMIVWHFEHSPCLIKGSRAPPSSPVVRTLPLVVESISVVLTLNFAVL